MITTLLATALTLGSVSVSVDGEGYIRFARNGRIVYSKSADLVVDEGRIEDSHGSALIPLIKVPSDVSELLVDADGTILGLSGRNRRELGRIMLAVFQLKNTVKEEGNYFVANSRPSLEDPGNGTAGLLIVDGTSTAPRVDSIRSRPPVTNLAGGKRAILILPETASLKGERIVLGEIATIEATETWQERIEAIDFGIAPKAGIPYKLSQDRIRAKLKLLGLKDSEFDVSGAPVVTIEAEGQLITSDAFVQAAIRAVTDKFGAVSDLQSDTQVSSYKAPSGSLELRAESIKTLKERVEVTLAIYVDQRRVNSKVVSITSPSFAVVVKMNQAVKVRMVTGAIYVEAIGRVKREARLGETVEVVVKVNDSGEESILIGTVVGPSLVEVKI